MATSWMDTVCNKQRFCDVDVFMHTVEKAEFLSQCFSSHDNNMPEMLNISELPVVFGGSLETATESITGMLLDSIPRTEFDILLGEGHYEGYRVIYNGPLGLFGHLKAFFGLNHLHSKAVKMGRDISNVIWKSMRKGPFDWSEIYTIEEFFEELLVTVGKLVLTSRLSTVPLLVLAADLALDGYLPFEVQRIDDTDKILVYGHDESG